MTFRCTSFLQFQPWRNAAALAGAGLLLVAGVLCTCAQGITINVVYNNAASLEPAADPNGDMLTDIVQAAADRWEDIIEDSFTMTMNVWYDAPGTFSSPGTLAVAPLVTANAADNRTVTGNIRFNNASNWFLDATPEDDEEYDFTQTLYRDLSGSDQALMYNVTTGTQLLEAGYVGAARSTAPPQAQNGWDMLTVALHELGHHLGVTNQLLKAQDQWVDGDYDLPPSLIDGRVIAARTGDNFGHLASDNNPPITIPTLLQQNTPNRTRRLPSATDVFAAAAVGLWTQIDLPRQDLLGGTTWQNAAAWAGGQLPGGADSAFLRLGGDVDLDGDELVGSLLVGDSTNLHTGAFRLDVAGQATIDYDGAPPFPQIFVEAGGELEADDLLIAGGELDMEGGLADIQNNLTINRTPARGAITGFGTVDVQDRLINNGLIAADDGTLTFTSSNPADVFDLDGPLGDGEVRAVAGNIVLAGNTFPTFVGEMTVGAGHFIEINDPWQLTIAGELNLNGGTTLQTEADVRGAALQASGTVNVDKRGELGVPLMFNSSATVNLPDSDDLLELASATEAITYNGGEFLGDGAVLQNGHATVSAGGSVLVDVGRFDLDGMMGNISTTLLTGSEMIVEVDELTDVPDGPLNITGALLSVTTAGGSWDYNGTMTFNPGGAGSSQVNGSTMNALAGAVLDFAGGTAAFNAPVGMLGAMQVEGIADFNEAISFGSGSTTTLVSGGVLRFNAFTNYNGNSISGDGTIQQNGTGFIVDNQTINLAGAFDWDGAANDSQFFINPQKTFNLNATSINLGNDIYSGRLTLINGTADVDVEADRWTMAGELIMNGAAGLGSTIAGDAVDVAGAVEARVGGAHVFVAESRFLTGSSTNVAAGTELRFQAPVEWSGGQHGGAGTIRVSVSGLIDGDAELDVGTFRIGASATVAMQGGELWADTVDKLAGGVFDFTGGTLHVDEFNGNLTNDGGILSPGGSPGLTEIIGDYRHNAKALLFMELAGAARVSEHDVLSVTGGVTLDGGALEVVLDGGFAPAAGNDFDILNFGSLRGVFDVIKLPLLPTMLAWDASQLYNTGVLSVVNAEKSADFDGDGDVDKDDLVEWTKSFGKGSFADADSDGDSDGADFLAWQRQLGGGAPAVHATTAAPEPGGAVMALLALVGLLRVRQQMPTNPPDRVIAVLVLAIHGNGAPQGRPGRAGASVGHSQL